MLLRSIIAVLALLTFITPAAVARSADNGSRPQHLSSTKLVIGQPVESLRQTAAENPKRSTRSADSDDVPLPDSMAAIGDSITRGFNACGFYLDCTFRSWATGTDEEVNSHYNDLLSRNPAIDGNVYNNAKTGASTADLKRQTELTVSQEAEYVTMLIGANDACATTEAGMTSVAAYKQQITNALSTLKTGLPDAKIFIASIPDIKQLWEAEKGNLAARAAWSIGHICQSMLANPTSSAPADNARRDRVRQRVVDYNKVLAAACKSYGENCKFDDNAVFSYKFSGRVLSNWDFFHPNVYGQQELSRITREAGFHWTTSSTSPSSVISES